MTTERSSGVPSPTPSIVRRPVSLLCTLTRDAGSPIAARAIALGPTGMRLATERPLAVDETVSFDLTCGEVRIRGHARVICQERPDLYAVRFGELPPPMQRRVREVVERLVADA